MPRKRPIPLVCSHCGEPIDTDAVMRHMAAIGGAIGGKRRLITMTPEHRKKVARLAAKARWAKGGTS